MQSTVNDVDARNAGEHSAGQYSKSAASTLKLVLLWLAVGMPLLWGVMQALEDVRNLLP